MTIYGLAIDDGDSSAIDGTDQYPPFFESREDASLWLSSMTSDESRGLKIVELVLWERVV